LNPWPKGNHGEAHVFQILHHLGGVPAVIGDFPDIVGFTQLLDEFLDETVVDDVPFGGLDEALLLPDIVKHMVTPAAQFLKCLPAARKTATGYISHPLPWREGQDQGRDI
jgi:hypothetical protein